MIGCYDCKGRHFQKLVCSIPCSNDSNVLNPISPYAEYIQPREW